MSVRNDSSLLAEPIASPHIPAHVNPSSVDLTLSPHIIDLGWRAWMALLPKPLGLAAWRRKGKSRLTIPPEGMWLWPGSPILASTVERISMPNDAAGLVLLKSTPARLGADHALACWFDAGFDGDGTLELDARTPFWMTPHTRLVQMVVFTMTGEAARPYGETGRYQGQRGPTEAR